MPTTISRDIEAEREELIASMEQLISPDVLKALDEIELLNGGTAGDDWRLVETDGTYNANEG